MTSKVWFTKTEIDGLVAALREAGTAEGEELAKKVEQEVAAQIPVRTYICAGCGKEFVQSSKGRDRVTCSDLCRQRKARRVRNPRATPKKWTEEEENVLLRSMSQHTVAATVAWQRPVTNWEAVAAGLHRTVKACQNKYQQLRRRGRAY